MTGRPGPYVQQVIMKAITVSTAWFPNTTIRCFSSARLRCCANGPVPVSNSKRKFFSVSSHPRHNSIPFKQYTFPSKPNNAERSQSPKMKRTAYIALGSNLGDRIGWIEKACNEMDARGIRVKRSSSLWETEPMYVLDQNRFVNGACEVRQFVHVYAKKLS